MATQTMCDSCLMPFKNDTGVRENEKYCSLCYSGGNLNYEGNDRNEFQEIVRKAMRSRGEGWFFTTFAVFMIRFAPRWQGK